MCSLKGDTVHAFGSSMDDSVQLPGAVLLDRKQGHIAYSIPACYLLPNDTVGREDISLVMLAAPTCDTNLIEVFSMFSNISFHVSSAETLLPQIVVFPWDFSFSVSGHICNMKL